VSQPPGRRPPDGLSRREMPLARPLGQGHTDFMYGRLHSWWIPATALMSVAGAVIASPGPLLAQGADTLFVWTQEPYRQDPTFIERNDGCGLWDPRRMRMMVIGGGFPVVHTGASMYQHQDAAVRAPGDAAWSFLAGIDPQAQPRLDEACAVLDSAGDAVWLFGGRHNVNNTPYYGYTSHVLGDLWRLDLSSLTWSIVTSTGLAPQPRVGASLSLDTARGRLWLFGGRDTLGRPLADLWSMDLAGPGSWVQWTPSGPAPEARSLHLAVVDASGDRLILAGGVGAGGMLADTWVMPLSQPGAWTDHGATAASPSGHVTGVLDPSRGRVVAAVDGVTVHTLALDTMDWALHVPFGTTIVGNPAILDPVDDQMVIAWAGTTVSTIGGGYTAPTAFLHFGALSPIVHLDASLTAAHFVAGVTELVWDLQFDHPLWLPAMLESTSTGGTGVIRYVQPDLPGPVSIGLYDPSLAGVSVQLRFRWFDGQSSQLTADVPLSFPPAPLTLHVTPDSLWQTGSDLHIWFSVPDDSARFLADQTLERADDGGPWTYRDRGFPNPSGIWTYDEIGVLPFRHYDYRIAWTGPDGVRRASAPIGRTILAAPHSADQRVYADSVVLTWQTAPGVDEHGVVFIQRPSAPGVWSDSIAWRTNAAGVITVRDTAVAPGQDYVYQLTWSDGTLRWDTQGIFIHTGGPAPAPPPRFSLGRAQPNPAQDGFDLPLEIPGSSVADVELFDITGRLRWHASVPAGTTMLHVETGGLESGVYVLRARCGGVIQTTRTAVMR
jgi:hypothetical protein